MTSDSDPVRHWNSLTSAEATRRANENPVVVLPLAATEHHGPHLPLSTDVDIARGLLAEAFRHLELDLPVWALPTQGVGASLEHARFDGTESVAAEQLVETICHLGRNVALSGVRRLVVSNSHGGNHAPIETAALRLREERDMLVVKASYYQFTRPKDVDLPESEWRYGLHGGAIETAMMLHLCPENVRKDRVTRFWSFAEELDQENFRITPTGAAAFAWLAGDLNPSGAVGDATLATVEIGQRLVTHYAGMLADVIRDASRFPIDRLTPR